MTGCCTPGTTYAGMDGRTKLPEGKERSQVIIDTDTDASSANSPSEFGGLRCAAEL